MSWWQSYPWWDCTVWQGLVLRWNVQRKREEAPCVRRAAQEATAADVYTKARHFIRELSSLKPYDRSGFCDWGLSCASTRRHASIDLWRIYLHDRACQVSSQVEIDLKVDTTLSFLYFHIFSSTCVRCRPSDSTASNNISTTHQQQLANPNTINTAKIPLFSTLFDCFFYCTVFFSSSLFVIMFSSCSPHLHTYIYTCAVCSFFCLSIFSFYVRLRLLSSRFLLLLYSRVPLFFLILYQFCSSTYQKK